jgi:hypothetical protein
MMAVTCINVASKLVEHDMNVPSLSSLRHASQFNIPRSGMMQAEAELLWTLDWDILRTTLYEYSSMAISQGWLFSDDTVEGKSIRSNTETLIKKGNLVLETLVNEVAKDSEMFQFWPSEVAGACVIAVWNALGVDYPYSETIYTYMNSNGAEIVLIEKIIRVKFEWVYSTCESVPTNFLPEPDNQSFRTNPRRGRTEQPVKQKSSRPAFLDIRNLQPSDKNWLVVSKRPKLANKMVTKVNQPVFSTPIRPEFDSPISSDEDYMPSGLFPSDLENPSTELSLVNSKDVLTQLLMGDNKTKPVATQVKDKEPMKPTLKDLEAYRQVIEQEMPLGDFDENNEELMYMLMEYA